LLINKNLRLVIFSYIIRFSLILTRENWIILWAILELNTLSFIRLYIASIKDKRSERRLRYYLIQGVSSLIIILAISSSLISRELPNLRNLFFFAIVIKLSLAPLHLWLIPIATIRKWNIFFLLLTLQKLIPLILLENLFTEITFFILFFCFISSFQGALTNFSSNTLKKILIFSRISNSAWLLISTTCFRQLWKIFFAIYSIILLFILIQNKKTKLTISSY